MTSPLPQLGMAQDAGKIVSWLKAPGDAVAKGDALLEVETDKAVIGGVEARASGFLTRCREAGEDCAGGAGHSPASPTARRGTRRNLPPTKA